MRRVPSAGYASGLAFFDDESGLLATARAGLYRTTDGGRTWAFALDTFDATIERLQWQSGERILAEVARLGLIRSDDGGRRWRQVYPRPPGRPAGPLSFSSARDGIGARSEGLHPDGGVIVATSDGGRGWRPRGRIPGFHVRQLERTSATDVWAVASRPLRNGGYAPTRVFRSADDGRTWRQLTTVPAIGFGTLSLVDEHVAFFYGERGTLRSDDGGASWSRRGDESIYSAAFLDRDRGYGTKGDDRLLITGDGGTTWKPVGLPGRFRVLHLSAEPPDRIWLVGNSCVDGRCRGRILRSQNGGREWTQINVRAAVPPSPTQWLEGRLGVAAVGAVGHYRTVDGGRTWRFVVAR